MTDRTIDFITRAILVAVVAMSLLLMVKSMAHAQSPEVYCFEPEYVYDMLVLQYEEAPFKVYGQYELWINPRTHTYTELWFPNDYTACVVGEGVYHSIS